MNKVQRTVRVERPKNEINNFMLYLLPAELNKKLSFYYFNLLPTNTL